MGLDSFTIRNLELFHSLANQGMHGTLIGTIDKTITASGSRLLKNWIRQPLTDKLEILDRLDRIGEFIQNKDFLDKIQNKLGWQPTINISEGIDEVISWVIENWDIIKSLPHDYIHKP